MTWVNADNAALLTDLYELTMAASYHTRGMNEDATFDLFVRHLPERRNFLIAAGLEQALDYLETFHFDDQALEYLSGLGFFKDDFVAFLGDLRFTGEVRAIPEGEAVFPSEPLLSVTAPLIEAQIVETFLLNCVLFQTMIASKAARVSLASGDKQFVDFSLRRDHGADAGLRAARASYIGGASATSNVLAGNIYGIEVQGTMAHSYIMAFGDELKAFRAFAEDFPDRAVLLIDTFDVEEGARRAAKVGLELQQKGSRLRGVRLDSGDVGSQARSVRKILDEAGLRDVQVVASGDLDEYRIQELCDDQAPIDAFGVGTQMGTSADAPALGGVYKLVMGGKGPVMKFSRGKATLPGRKQVHRFLSGDTYERDLIALEDERLDGGVPLLQPVMHEGVRISEREPLAALRDRCRRSLDALPEPLCALDRPAEYPVGLSPQLKVLLARMSHESH